MLKFSDKGIITPPILFLSIIILVSILITFKNLPLNQPKPTPYKQSQATNSAQVKNDSPSATSKSSSSSKPKASSQPSSSSTTSSNSSSESNPTSSSNPSTNQTNTTSQTATTGSIAGTIKDQNGNALGYATFKISCSCTNLRNGNFQDEQVNSSGSFTINNLPLTSLTLKPFYTIWGETKTVNILAGQTINVDLKVDRSSVTQTPAPTTNSTPFVKITFPNGGETFKYGEKMNITWEASGDYSTFYIGRTDCPSCLGFIANVDNGNSRSYEWTIGNWNIGTGVYSRKFKIKIIGYLKNSVNGISTPTDESDSDFTITN